ncbi:MAG: arginine repressor [Bryobacterales bacterium]|nr:arginine repressor [Bryobacterales bacterium]
MSKSFRHGQILKLIRGGAIMTQEELARELRKQGIDVTQVTLSRDLRELGLVKTAEGYQTMSARETGPSLEGLAAEFLYDARAARNLVVLRTRPGHASSVAVALDNEEWQEVVGTIAGDDTVLVIAPDDRTAESLRKSLLAMIRD